MKDAELSSENSGLIADALRVIDKHLNNPEIPPSSRDEGLRLLHGLATNLATSLQTPQEA